MRTIPMLDDETRDRLATEAYRRYYVVSDPVPTQGFRDLVDNLWEQFQQMTPTTEPTSPTDNNLRAAVARLQRQVTTDRWTSTYWTARQDKSGALDAVDAYLGSLADHLGMDTEDTCATSAYVNPPEWDEHGGIPDNLAGLAAREASAYPEVCPTGPYPHTLQDTCRRSTLADAARCGSCSQHVRIADLECTVSGLRAELAATLRRLERMTAARELADAGRTASAYQETARQATDRLAAIQRILNADVMTEDLEPQDTRTALDRAREAHLDALRRLPESGCSAHGGHPCDLCSRTQPGGLDDLGNCTQCGVYASTGHHWDTCSNRVR